MNTNYYKLGVLTPSNNKLCSILLPHRYSRDCREVNGARERANCKLHKRPSTLSNVCSQHRQSNPEALAPSLLDASADTIWTASWHWYWQPNEHPTAMHIHEAGRRGMSASHFRPSPLYAMGKCRIWVHRRIGPWLVQKSLRTCAPPARILVILREMERYKHTDPWNEKLLRPSTGPAES